MEGSCVKVVDVCSVCTSASSEDETRSSGARQIAAAEPGWNEATFDVILLIMNSFGEVDYIGRDFDWRAPVRGLNVTAEETLWLNRCDRVVVG